MPPQLVKCEQCARDVFPNELSEIVRDGFAFYVCRSCATPHGESERAKREKAKARAWQNGDGWSFLGGAVK